VRTPDLPKGTTVTYKIRYMNSDGSYTSYSGTGTITL
jgi:diaminopimelate epimerase